MPPNLNDAFFRRDCRELCRELIGKVVRFGETIFTICNADAYPENVGAHRPVSGLPPGDVYISQFMGQNPLLLIACLNGEALGASVRITEIEITKTSPGGAKLGRVTGPAGVCKALGLQMRAKGMLVVCDDGQLLLSVGDPEPVAAKPKKPAKART